MTWTWMLEDADGNAIDTPDSDLGSQGDAESWLGERWREFAEQGAAAAILLEDGRQVYRMELSPAEE
ncbi:hypothetical protein O1R50_20455 [Glycomyces luteolus]|uniref:Uncharacterized protein n=1 Tax=Glycomyces luteolus TaxID=2670330 RepID=A0A9X3STA7_9ACTN|nr:hypothetical protein [Glycomyces luteolus]MDA1362009.1 hypothetical protein [Glycomyces luteolus]